VPASGQTMAFSWVSNIQIVSGAFVSLVAGVFSDLVGIWFPFVFAGVLTVAIFFYYAPRGPEFFGAGGGASADAAVTPEGAI